MLFSESVKLFSAVCQVTLIPSSGTWGTPVGVVLSGAAFLKPRSFPGGGGGGQSSHEAELHTPCTVLSGFQPLIVG